MKTPSELAAEMEHMVKLHPDFLWAVVMAEGAQMIRSLDQQNAKKQD
jgi:hypothetical protein